MYKKTVIAEIKKHYALVIDEDGEMHRIKLKKGMRIGDRINYIDEDHYRLVDQKKNRKLPRWMVGATAAAVVFVLIAYQLFSSPGIPVAHAIISIGAENGIQIELNEEQQIQRVLDQNGNVMDLPELTGKTWSEAVSNLVSFVEGLDAQDIPVSIAAETSEWDNQIKEQLLTHLQENLAQTNLIFLAGNMDDSIEAPGEGSNMNQEEEQNHLGDTAEFYQFGDDDDIEIEVIVPDADDDDDIDDDFDDED